MAESIDVPKIEYELKGNERILAILAKEIHELKSEVRDLKTQKLVSETQISEDILEENNLLPKLPERFKRGKGYRPILKHEIEEVQKRSPNESAAARLLGVSGRTYRKYARMYGIYKPKPNIKGVRGLFDPNRGKHPLTEILDGKHPDVSIWTVKDKLLRSGLKKLECEICGFNQRRTGDNKIPLLLNHMDNDIHNHRLENLKLLCLNCTFMAGRGYIRRSKYLLDPDWLQGMNKEERGKESRY